MNQDTSQRIIGTASTKIPDSQEYDLQNSNIGAPPNDAASQAIVQCLLIAARRGRQIRLAREQATQLRQSEPRSVIEEIPGSNKT
jgi:hypothetical protein